MITFEMLYEFERLLETIYPDAKIEDKQDTDATLLALNIAQRRYLYDKYLSKATIKENIEYLQKRSDDLRNLIIRGELMDATAISTGPLSGVGYTVDLSSLTSKYLFYLRSDTLLTRTAPPVVSVAAWTNNDIVNSYEELDKIVPTIYNKPLLRQPVVALEGSDKLLIVTDVYTSVDTTGTIAVTYLKFPKDLGFTGTSTLVKVTKGSKTVSVYIKAADGTSDFTASTASVAAATTTLAYAFPSTDGKTFTFDAVALGSGAGHTLVVIGETKYLVADAGTDAQNATAIAAAINAGTQATASVSTATVTITYKAGTIGNLPPMVLKSDDDSTWTLVAVTIASGDSKQVVYRTDAATTTAATFTLDEPWQGETGYVYEGTTAVTAGVATLTTGLWGLKFSGLALPFDAIVGKYEIVRFNVKPKLGNQMINPITGTGYTYALGFDSSVLAYDVQAAKEGTGMYQQVAEEELLASWQNRPMVVQTWPPTKYSTEASASKEYSITALRIKKTNNAGTVGHPNSYITINIAVDKSLTTNDNAVLATVFAITAIA